jgi:hypothetical protein
MKNPVMALLLIAVVVCGVAIYRGWFSVDQQKIEQDEKAAKAAVNDIEQKIKEKATDLTSPAKGKK